MIYSEMNCHMPQSYQTMEELKQLTAVPTQIISPKDSSPIMSVVQDVCLGVYRLTKHHVRIPERQFFNLLTTNEKFTGILPTPHEVKNNTPLYTGAQTLSLVMPERLNTEFNLANYDDNIAHDLNIKAGNVLIVKNGQIQAGACDKTAYQKGTRGIVHSIFNEYGPEATRDMYDHTQKLVCDWLVYDGFSVGVSDLIVEQNTKDKFKQVINNMKKKAYEFIHQVHEGKFENNSTYNNQQWFEREINNLLNKAIKDVGNEGLGKIDPMNNRMINMVKSKSKGNPNNVAQMIGCVGQQNVDGRRIPYGFDDRTLPHYSKYDDGPESRGFVENSFIQGLTPQEFYFHAMGGREGLIDTAVQSVTGDTEIMIMENNTTKVVKIGDWIDTHLAQAGESQIKLFPEQHNMEYMLFNDTHTVLVPTCDEKGIASWGQVTAITRHDPGAKLFEITTQGGRSVKVVDSKSLIIWDCEKQEFVEVNTSQVRVGDKLPVANRLLGFEVLDTTKCDEFNDVILDPIAYIDELDVAQYEKVYDITVPSTLNFMIKNRLIVRDTSETGYLQRKLVKAMEDCKVNYDMSVRNALGVIIQFLYGEDGMDACKLESQALPYIRMDVQKIKAVYNLVEVGINDFKPFMSKDAFAEAKANSEEIQKRMMEHYKQILADRDHIIHKMFHGNVADVNITYPVAFQRIITTIENMYTEAGVMPPSDLSPLYVLDKIDELSKELVVCKGYPGNFMMKILLRCFLSPKQVICRHHLTKKAFDNVVDQVRFRFFESLATPSEMVGVIAAQSIGEPATQLVLNTFHSSGISSASEAVRGVPRLNELLAVSKNIKTPQMHIHLKPSLNQDITSCTAVNKDKKKCMEIMNEIRTVRFKDIIKSSKIYFDPDDNETSIPDDEGFLRVYHAFAAKVKTTGQTDVSPWLLRLELDREKLLEYKVDMITLHYVLDNFYDDVIQCMFSDDNAEQLIMRIRPKVDKSDDSLTDLKALEHNILETIVIKGIKNIERAALEEDKHTVYNPVTKSFDTEAEWIIFTAGTNLREVLTLPFINAEKTKSNDVNEIYEIFGIEAARAALYNEIMDVLGSIHVNYRHIALLVDVMTNRGVILSVNRHGINRGDIGPLAKCSFEETTDKLIKAGIFAEQDKINGVSANVMLGQIAPCGTGDAQVIIDEEIMGQLQASQVTFAYNDQENEFMPTSCTQEELAINLPRKVIQDAQEEDFAKTDNDIVFV